MHSIYIIENPLMDYVMHEDYGFLKPFDAKVGTMQLVDFDIFSRIITASSNYKVLPGGSGANTARAVAMLIGPDGHQLGTPAFSGSIGGDDAGKAFETCLREQGVDTSLTQKDIPTGVSAIVVTPDHERTMFTYLGACRDFARSDLNHSMLSECKFFYSTGYMWDTEPQKDALFGAVEDAMRSGSRVCFDLADPFVVDRYHKDLRTWLRGRVDILFANRQELSRMTSCSGDDREIISCASDLAKVVIMKVGKHGCWLLESGRIKHIPGEEAVCRDSTGAGDSFSAGFIYGLLDGRSMEDCARLGNRLASRVVAVEGVDFSTLDREEIL